MERVIIAWILLFGIIMYDIHTAFTRYREEKKPFKLGFHLLLLASFGIMNINLGIFCLKMQFDAPSVFNTYMIRSKEEFTAARQHHLTLGKTHQIKTVRFKDKAIQDKKR